MRSATLVQSTVPLPNSLHRCNQQSYSEAARQAQRIAKITQNHTGPRRTMQNRTGKCRTSRTMLDQAGAGRSRQEHAKPESATGSHSSKGRPTTLASNGSTDRSSYSGDSSRKLTMSCFYSLPTLSAQLPTAKLPAQHAKPLVPASLQNQA